MFVEQEWIWLRAISQRSSGTSEDKSIAQVIRGNNDGKAVDKLCDQVWGIRSKSQSIMERVGFGNRFNLPKCLHYKMSDLEVSKKI